MVPLGGGDEVESWEDIAADEPKTTPTVTTDAQPSTVSKQDSEPTTATSNTTIPMEEPTSSPTDQKEVEDSSSDTNVTVKTVESQTTEASSKNSPESQLKAKGQQVDHSSPSATPLPKTKAIAAPQRAEDDKENVNIVFIGHVDAGKSTIGGHVMLVYFSWQF